MPLPSLGMAIAPIIIPIVLMNTDRTQFISFPEQLKVVKESLEMMCSPSFALGIGMLLSFRLLHFTCFTE